MKPAEQAAEAASIERPTALSLFFWGLCVWALCIMPVLVLMQVDALLIYRTPAEIWRDIARLTSLCIVPAASFAAFGLLAGVIARRLGAEHASPVWAWAVAIAPTAALGLWQWARAAAVFLRPASEFHVSAGPGLRAAAALSIGLLFVVLMKYPGPRRLLQILLPPALALRHLVLALTIAALAVIAIDSHPVFHTMAPPPQASTTAAERRPDVFLITLDSLAAEDANVCGTGPTTMPHLRALTARATCFSRHYASSNFTTPTTSTIETGTLPWTHWAGQVGAQLVAPLRGKTLAMALHQAGYRTISVNANYLASPRHHGTYAAFNHELISHSTSAVNQFEALLSSFADSSVPLLVLPLLPPEIDSLFVKENTPVDPKWTYDQALHLIKQSPARSPLFVWAHTLPPHAPYLPPPSTKYRLLPRGELVTAQQFRVGNTPYAPAEQALVDKHRLRYQETVMGADEELGAFIGHLERMGRFDDAIVIVSADHGESFEHGLLGHAGPLLHDALTRIPLVIKLPRQRQGRIVAEPVSQADIAPTVLAVTGSTPLSLAEGRSLLPALEGRALERMPVFTMAMERQSRFRPLAQGHFALVEGPHKLVLHLQTGAVELFDLDQDPEERNNLADGRPEIAAKLKAILQARLTQIEGARQRSFGP